MLYDSGSSNPMLCDDLEGWGEEGCEVGGRFEREGAYSCLWLIHVDIWQKPTQYCKAILFQLKVNTFFKKCINRSHLRYYNENRKTCHTDCLNIFANHICNKRLASKIYNKLMKVIT